MASFVKDLNAIVGTLWLTGALAFNGIPGTGTLRSLFLLFGLIHLFWTIFRQKNRPTWPDHGPEAKLLMVLLLWLFAQSFIFASAPIESLRDIVFHWGKILILVFSIIAFLAYSDDVKNTRNWLVLGTFLSGFLHVIGTLGFQVFKLVSTGQFLIGESLLGNYGYISPYITMSLAILIAEIIARLSFNKKVLPFRFSLIWLLFSLNLCAEGLLAAKAGYLMSALQLILGSCLIALLCKTHRRFIAILIPVVFTASLAIPLLFANRWVNISESIPASIKASTDVFDAFVSPDSLRPEIDPSIFLRYSWAKAGLDAISGRPMGYGYGSTGYGKFIHEKTGFSGAVSSHSGWIDFTIDNGIPGFFLFILLTGALLKRGWTSFLLYGNPASLALVFTIVNYVGRCAIDGHLVGSRLTGFALATAALWAASSVMGCKQRD